MNPVAVDVTTADLQEDGFSPRAAPIDGEPSPLKDTPQKALIDKFAVSESIVTADKGLDAHCGQQPSPSARIPKDFADYDASARPESHATIHNHESVATEHHQIVPFIKKRSIEAEATIRADKRFKAASDDEDEIRPAICDDEDDEAMLGTELKPAHVSSASTSAGPSAKNQDININGYGNLGFVAQGKIKQPTAGETRKAKRELESQQFPAALLADLTGTTSAEVRKMTSYEKDLVKHKRKIRNRESAKRSRENRQKELKVQHDQIGEGINATIRMLYSAAKLAAIDKKLVQGLEVKRARIRELRRIIANGRDGAGGDCVGGDTA